MILHTIEPYELVFPPQEDVQQPVCARVRGQLVMGMRQGQSLTVSRLLTTDPAAYLDPDFAPGAQHMLTPEITDMRGR